jgi:carboxylesterase
VKALMSGQSVDAGLLATPSSALRELWRLVAELKPWLSQIKQRVLIIQAREDETASLKNAEYLQRHLGGPVEALILDDSYHLITIDRQRGLVMQRAAEFVKSFVPSTASDSQPKGAVKLHILPAAH